MKNYDKYKDRPLREAWDDFKKLSLPSSLFENWLAGSTAEPEKPGHQADPLPGALGALTGLLAAGFAGRNGEPPHVNVWIMVNGRTA